jgi:hydroxypyruvate isomerase
MPRFAANLSTLFTDVPLLQRFERAARAGFNAVEVQFPYEAPAAALRQELQRHGLQMVLHNLPPGDYARGERGIACHPGREAEFRAQVAQAIEYATTLGVPQLNCLAGLVPAGADPARLRATLVGNLRHAARELGAAGLKLLVEPLNRFDVPGFYLHDTAQALALLDEVGADNAFVQYDIYHAQRSEGEIAATLQRQLARIGHVQFADNPGRREPGTGELNFPFLFAHLDRIGYSGFVSAEYFPAGRTEDSLGWFERQP